MLLIIKIYSFNYQYRTLLWETLSPFRRRRFRDETVLQELVDADSESDQRDQKRDPFGPAQNPTRPRRKPRPGFKLFHRRRNHATRDGEVRHALRGADDTQRSRWQPAPSRIQRPQRHTRHDARDEHHRPRDRLDVPGTQRVDVLVPIHTREVPGEIRFKKPALFVFVNTLSVCDDNASDASRVSSSMHRITGDPDDAVETCVSFRKSSATDRRRGGYGGGGARRKHD